jgi:hypothetical protein
LRIEWEVIRDGKRPTNPILSGSVVWSPVSSGFQISPDEVVHERVGAVVACQRRDSMRAIFWDGDGFVIWYKWPERGTWQLPAADSETLELEAHELCQRAPNNSHLSQRRSCHAPFSSPLAGRV